MMCRKIIAVLVVLAFSVCNTASAAVIKYNFSQSGFDSGGILTGTFEGEDLDGDGSISITENVDFNMEFSGNSTFPDITGAFIGLYDFTFIIKEQRLLIEGESSHPLGDIVFYVTDKYSSFLLDFYSFPTPYGADETESFELMKISIVPIPSAAWLFGSGLIGMIGVRHKLKTSTKSD